MMDELLREIDKIYSKEFILLQNKSLMLMLVIFNFIAVFKLFSEISSSVTAAILGKRFEYFFTIWHNIPSQTQLDNHHPIVNDRVIARHA